MRSLTLPLFRILPANRRAICCQQNGLSLVELLAALGIAALIFAALAGVISQALETERVVRAHNDIHQQARFAMQQMVEAVSHSPRLMLPLAENPVTAWSESIRDPGVLAVTLDPMLDRDNDGFADADNDKDGSVDEDLAADATKDAKSGIIGIDDDNDGSIDEAAIGNDDEDASPDEDSINGIDDDNDGSIDEDASSDMNGDGFAGTGGTGNVQNDDGDSSFNEDWYDPVVFFLAGSTLMQRIPNINPADGTDYTEYPIATGVSQFRVERIAQGLGRAVLVDLSLTLTDADGESAPLNTRIRIGGGL